MPLKPPIGSKGVGTTGPSWLDRFFDWLRGLLDKAERPKPTTPPQPPASNVEPKPTKQERS